MVRSTVKTEVLFLLCQTERDEADLIDLKNVIGKLGERERRIIVMRYFGDMTQKQTGDILGISQVQVSRIEKKVLEKMRENLSLYDKENG